MRRQAQLRLIDLQRLVLGFGASAALDGLTCRCDVTAVGTSTIMVRTLKRREVVNDYPISQTAARATAARRHPGPRTGRAYCWAVHRYVVCGVWCRSH